ncbi:hypothetical protein C8R44DRAFT_752165 [Mycena epipterygia]|nr:hypothetical protein C8R44DRAFT_752165 [Mycena epipterygia]
MWADGRVSSAYSWKEWRRKRKWRARRGSQIWRAQSGRGRSASGGGRGPVFAFGFGFNGGGNTIAEGINQPSMCASLSVLRRWRGSGEEHAERARIWVGSGGDRLGEGEDEAQARGGGDGVAHVWRERELRHAPSASGMDSAEEETVKTTPSRFDVRQDEAKSSGGRQDAPFRKPISSPGTHPSAINHCIDFNLSKPPTPERTEIDTRIWLKFALPLEHRNGKFLISDSCSVLPSGFHRTNVELPFKTFSGRNAGPRRQADYDTRSCYKSSAFWHGANHPQNMRHSSDARMDEHFIQTIMKPRF